jgi:hypothetical protein
VKDNNTIVGVRVADRGNTIRITPDMWEEGEIVYVNYNKVDGSADAQLSFSDPKVPLSIKVDTKEVRSIAVGVPVTISTTGMNLFEKNVVDLIIIGPKGQIRTDWLNSQQFTGISVAELKAHFGDMNLKTEGWTIGNYTFQIKTVPEKACNLEAESEVKALTIKKRAIEIATNKSITTITTPLPQTPATVIPKPTPTSVPTPVPTEIQAPEEKAIPVFGVIFAIAVLLLLLAVVYLLRRKK